MNIKLMEREASWRSNVVLFKGRFTDDDIKSLDKVYRHLREADMQLKPEDEMFQHPNLLGNRASNHITAFLHVGQLIDDSLPDIAAKVQATMVEADRMEGWGYLTPASDEGTQVKDTDPVFFSSVDSSSSEKQRRYNVRVCEYHEYFTGGEVCNPYHCDGGSLVTMSVMLSNPETDFTGGEFTTLDPDSKEDTEHDFQRGDAIVFVSEKYHSVQPIETGVRHSLVTELWAGPRCLTGREE